jgi:hypothetical protein
MAKSRRDYEKPPPYANKPLGICHPKFSNFPCSHLFINFYITQEGFFGPVATDFHQQNCGNTFEILIGTKRPAAGMGGNQFVFFKSVVSRNCAYGVFQFLQKYLFF